MVSSRSAIYYSATACSMLFLLLSLAVNANAQSNSTSIADDCAALRTVADLTITFAELRENTEADQPYCYVRGIIAPAIHFHAQLPLPANWNGRFLQWGDGGKDGDLDFANHRVAEGYAVTNSNTGHDSATEPGSAFGFNNRQSEIDFGYRAIHLTTLAGKALVNHYYERPAQYSYFEGCSTGGRQGLMEAQRFPDDFDGIVAGAPVNFYQAMNAAGVWHLQQFAKDDYAGNLAVDADGDGNRENVELVSSLNRVVLEKCDATDGIRDGVIDDALACAIDPAVDLADYQCANSLSNTDADASSCFTDSQIQAVTNFYRGPVDTAGNSIYPGKLPGSELDWINLFMPTARNGMTPGMLSGPAGDHVNYLFYEADPGVTIPDLANIHYQARRSGMNPEYHWLAFDIQDFADGKAQLMSSIMDATDPDLSSFLKDRGGKLIVYHGLTDALSVARATEDYFTAMVDTTFAGSFSAANEHARLFLAPGMGHCGGGPGPNTWDKLLPLVDWVENGVAPATIKASHSSNGVVDNERLLCPFPQRARYSGPARGENDPANWIATNFQCQ